MLKKSKKPFGAKDMALDKFKSLKDVQLALLSQAVFDIPPRIRLLMFDKDDIFYGQFQTLRISEYYLSFRLEVGCE